MMKNIITIMKKGFKKDIYGPIIIIILLSVLTYLFNFQRMVLLEFDQVVYNILSILLSLSISQICTFDVKSIPGVQTKEDRKSFIEAINKTRKKLFNYLTVTVILIFLSKVWPVRFSIICAISFHLYYLLYSLREIISILAIKDSIQYYK